MTIVLRVNLRRRYQYYKVVTNREDKININSQVYEYSGVVGGISFQEKF